MLKLKKNYTQSLRSVIQTDGSDISVVKQGLPRREPDYRVMNGAPNWNKQNSPTSSALFS